MPITMVNTIQNLSVQFKSLRRYLGLVLVPPILILLIATFQPVAPMWMLMRDPVSIAGLPPYTGAISSIGAFLWCAAASISLFVSLATRRGMARSRRSDLLFWGAVLTFLLMIDDFFTVHEVIAFHLNIPDFAVIGVYAAIAGMYFAFFTREILRTEYLVLLIALAFLGSSIVVDALDPKDSPLIEALVGDRYHLVEDGPKFMGIAAWLGYFARVSWVQVRSPGSQRLGGAG